MATASIEMRKEELLASALEAGFIRARIAAPFIPDPGAAPPESLRGYGGGAPALLMVALAYPASGTDRGPNSPNSPKTNLGRIAPFAQGNYYAEAVRRLQTVAKSIRHRCAGHRFGNRSEYRILCNSPVPEKPLAQACGLGWLGRNGLVITPEAGSRVILAGLTLPFPLAGDGPLPGDPCSACGAMERSACAAMCPTQALPGDGSLIRERCIQWYASGKGERVPPAVARNWGTRFYGCTECLDACPRNRRTVPGTATALGVLPEWVDAAAILAMDDGELKDFVRGSALGMAWLGPGGLRRNAALVLGRYEEALR
jgi:epoxyqueuosine reductase